MLHSVKIENDYHVEFHVNQEYHVIFFQRLVKMKFLLSWEEAEEEPWDALFLILSIDENYLKESYLLFL